MSYLSKHPEIKELTCRYCRVLKSREDMRSQFRCNDCYRAAKAANLMAFYLKKVDQPDPEPVPPAPTIITRPARIWPRAKKASVCEDYIGNSIGIPDLAKKYETSQTQISKVISQYFGFHEKPVIFQIRAEGGYIDPEP